MKWILSRYEHDISYLVDYTKDWVMYDRSQVPVGDSRVIKTPNIGTDIRDKFTYIIDNYENLPEIAVYTKANIFKYINKDEFEEIKDNKTFTPILTQTHKVYEPVCRYNNGMYEEINNGWFLSAHPPKSVDKAKEVYDIMGLRGREYVQFAPGSNYILPKENILQHPKEHYEKLRSYLEWAVYPGEAQIIERGLYYLWQL